MFEELKPMCEPRGKVPRPCGKGLYVLLLHCSSGRVIKPVNQTEKTAFYFCAHAYVKHDKSPGPKACSL